ncbi:MAG: DUF2946 family protein [Leptothrix sp. (in: b-proteobacteria)]
MRTQQARVIWIAVFAAILHALLPALHQLSAQEQLQAVCTLGGQLTLVAVDTAADPTQRGEPANTTALKALECPLCLAGAHLADAPPTSQPLSFARPELSFIAPILRVPVAHQSRRTLAFSSRAPPVLS